ncbi:MAG: WcaI family glycosyltransferase [Pseudomonadota bacterium]|nr:WcaI family glycosyltransferase [Pseudomonadota bacterium]
MNILICTVNFSPELTATGKYTGEMAAWLQQNGNTVDAIAAPPHYPKWEVDQEYKGKGFLSQVEQGVNVMRVPCYIPSANKLSSKTRILMESTFSLLSLFWWLPILFRKKKYDVVISICPPMQTALFPYLYKLIRGVPYIFHIQDFQVDMAMELGMLKKGPLTRLLFRIEQFLLRKATMVTTITDAMRNRAVAKGIPKERLALCPNWSNIDTIRPGNHNNPFRTAHGFGEHDFLVLYSGGMGEKQGLEVILQAAESLKGDSRIKFIIVGNGGAKKNLQEDAERLALTNVTFLDLQPLEALPEMFSAANVHLVIQKSQATDLVMPSKLTNILASGRPAIATAYPDSALGMVIEKHDTGLLIPPESCDHLREAILTLCESPVLANEKGINARAYAERFLDIDCIMAEFNTLLNDIATRHKD